MAISRVVAPFRTASSVSKALMAAGTAPHGKLMAAPTLMSGQSESSSATSGTQYPEARQKAPKPYWRVSAQPVRISASRLSLGSTEKSKSRATWLLSIRDRSTDMGPLPECRLEHLALVQRRVHADESLVCL